MKQITLSVTLLWFASGLLFNLWQEDGNRRKASADDAQLGSEIKTSDLRTTKTGTTQNADASFVGRNTCKECHAENHAWHGKHGHHTTFAKTDDPTIVKMFDGKSYDSGSRMAPSPTTRTKKGFLQDYLIDLGTAHFDCNTRSVPLMAR